MWGRWLDAAEKWCSDYPWITPALSLLTVLAWLVVLWLWIVR